MADPATIALIISGLVAGGRAIGGAVGRANATRPLRRRNEAEINRLQGLEDQGMLGLGPEQRAEFINMLHSPIQQAAMAQRERGERIGAASRGQGFGAAELQDMRRDQARTEGSARAGANAQVFAADQAREQQQRSELEARMGARSAEQIQQMEANLGVVDALGQGIAPLGAAVAANQAGRQFAQQVDISKLSSDELSELITALSQSPEGLQMLRYIGGF